MLKKCKQGNGCAAGGWLWLSALYLLNHARAMHAYMLCLVCDDKKEVTNVKARSKG